MKKLSWLSLLACSGLLALDMVRDGVPAAEIVVDEGANPCVQLAAKELQLHLEKMSGAKLEIVNEPNENALHKIYVGSGKHLKKLGYEMPLFSGSGYDICIEKEYAVLTGPETIYADGTAVNPNGMNKALSVSASDDCGALHAVSAFLEELGIRFYAPYEDGTIIPKRSSISMEPCRITRKAAFGRRDVNLGAAVQDAETLLWFKRLKCGSNAPVISGHTLEQLFQDENTYKRHPSWFAEKEPGILFSRAAGVCLVPRYTDPDFQRACLEWARKQLKANPNVRQISFGMPKDVGFKYDWRDVEKYEPYGSNPMQGYANMIYDFQCALARELKKSHPEVSVIWWCQHDNQLPNNADAASIPDNFACHLCSIYPSWYAQPNRYGKYCGELKALYQFFNPKVKTLQYESWMDFSDKGTARFPEYFMHQLQTVRQMQLNYFDGVEMEVATDGSRLAEVPITHLMLYISSKLLWEPSLDVDALLKEYYQLWYGPAAGFMEDFHNYAESVWCRKGARVITREKEGFIKPGDIQLMSYMLKNARASVQPDTSYGRHVAAIADAFAWLDTAFESTTPAGPWTEATILSTDTPLDGDFAKYTSRWMTLKGEAKAANRTEVNYGITENGKKMFLAARCYDSSMKRLAAKTTLLDDGAIFQDDRLELYLGSQRRKWFFVAINAAGAIYDETKDLELINDLGYPLAWSSSLPREQKNREFSSQDGHKLTPIYEPQAVVRRFNDRWEVETVIDIADLRAPGPADYAPWGLNVSRVRFEDGKSSRSSLAPEGGDYAAVNQSKWLRLWRKMQQVDGRFIPESSLVLQHLKSLPEPYRVPRAKGAVDLAGEWNSPSWEYVKPVKLNYNISRPGDKEIYLPDTQAKVQYDSDYLYVMFQVKDHYVKVVETANNSSVCRDSCVEFFCRPQHCVEYTNFECNAGGHMLLYIIEDITNGKLAVSTDEELESIKRFHSMPSVVLKEIQEPTTWRVAYRIPLDIFVRRLGIDKNLAGQVWDANFYKCADGTSHRQWQQWFPASAFHCPNEFGKMIFE